MQANLNPILRFVTIALTLILLNISTAYSAGKNSTEWKEEYAYTLGMQAYIYGYPWVFLPKIRYQWVATTPENPDITPNMALNHFWHGKNIITSDYRDGGAPNNDTLYSITWLDLKAEPIILSHGNMEERYFTFEIASMTSDNIDYVGTRTTGSKAGNFAIVGPNWIGELPKGVKKLATSPTNSVLIFGRTAVKGLDDVVSANEAQENYQLTPLSQWGSSKVIVPDNRNVFIPFDKTADPLADWKTMNKAMTENPPIGQHAVLLDMFKKIGVGPNMDVSKTDEATQKGLVRAAKDGFQMLENILATGADLPKINGWSFPPETMGRAGINNDFNTLAIQCMGGIIANDPEEAIYINTHSDFNGDTLIGNNKYQIRFEAGQLPDVEYFWSLTMYDLTNNLVENPIDRWAIGSLAGGYQLAEDGSLTLYVQKDSPGKDKESNWLPTPAGEFWVVFRTYGPNKSIIDQTWEMPGLIKVK